VCFFRSFARCGHLRFCCFVGHFLSGTQLGAECHQLLFSALAAQLSGLQLARLRQGGGQAHSRALLL